MSATPSYRSVVTWTNCRLSVEVPLTANQEIHYVCGIGVDFRSTRSQKAPPKRLSLFYCGLLPPREIAKSFSANEMVGRGGGDRIHDPRLKSLKIALQANTRHTTGANETARNVNPSWLFLDGLVSSSRTIIRTISAVNMHRLRLRFVRRFPGADHSQKCCTGLDGFPNPACAFLFRVAQELQAPQGYPTSATLSQSTPGKGCISKCHEPV